MPPAPWAWGFGSLVSIGIVWVLVYGGTGSSAVANIVCGVIVVIALAVTLGQARGAARPPAQGGGPESPSPGAGGPELEEWEALTEETRRMMSGR